MKTLKKTIIIILSLLFLTSCANVSEKKYVEKLEDINGLRMAIPTGSCHEQTAKKMFPDCTFDYYTYQTVYDAIINKKADVTLVEYPAAVSATKQLEDLAMMEVPNMLSENAFGFPIQTNDLYNDFNTFLTELSNNGTIKELNKKWFDDLSTENIDWNILTGKNGTLNVAIITNNTPYAFYSNNQITGLEPEIIYLYCLSKGYNVEFAELELSGILAALNTGNCDFAAGSITITEERKESIKFTVPYYSSNIYAVLRKEDLKQVEDPIAALKGKTVACVSESVYIPIVNNRIDDVQIAAFTSITDCISSLQNGKASAVACSKNLAETIIKETSNLKILTEIGYEEIGLIATKDEVGLKYITEFNSFLAQYQQSGELIKLREKYNDINNADMPEFNLTGENGSISIAIEPSSGAPYDYIKEGRLIGYEVELLYLFAVEYGYDIDIMQTNFASVLAAVSSSRANFGAAAITITEERKQSMHFSNAIDSCPIVLIVQAETDEKESNFFETIINNFNKTFIKEDRWKMFIEGAGETLLISISSIILGTFFGLILYLLFRTNLKIVDMLIRIYSWLISGMPTVMLLMTLFYIVLAKTSLNGAGISIIGFTAIFSITIFGILKQSFNAINIGQFEASYALGYTRIQTFFKIILPQTMPMFLPLFKSEVVSLIKATAIVGYIAVQDLTKASDLVRSRTYEAFFPLIGATVLYFMIAAIFNISINLLMKTIDPKHRKKEKILKGVKIK